jgi:hypothetical protein
MDFGTVKGVVYFRGIFQITPPKPQMDEKEIERVTVNTLYSFEKKIRSIPGISDIVFQFTNWRKQRGQWFPVKPKELKGEDGKQDS